MAVHAFQWAMMPVAASEEGNTVVAASASLADVQAAVDAAVDGDTVTIPNGSVTWTGGITTTKQIIIKAQNTTPTPAGCTGSPNFTIRTPATSRNVTITHNAGDAPLFTFTTGNSYSCGVIGIRFNIGTGTGANIVFNGTGSKPPLLGDCTMQHDQRGWPSHSFVEWSALGGVVWNCYFYRSSGGLDALGGSASILTSSPRSWETASTMGSLDTNGNVNLYIEDTTFMDLTTGVDIDQRGRVVFRNCVDDGASLLTHGFTSGSYAAGRHAEMYDCKFQCTTTARNLGRYFWLRAGTILITDCLANDATDTSSYNGGHLTLLDIGDNTSPSGSDGAMQPGWGHNGTTDVRDPIYIWNITGTRNSTYGFNDQYGNWSGVTTVATTEGQSDGELFYNLGAKPGWSRYTYPHPARPY